MTRAPRTPALALGFAGALLLPSCAFQRKQEEKQAEAMRVNCSTAEGDLRVLRSEKAHVLERMAMGATAIYPPSAGPIPRVCGKGGVCPGSICLSRRAARCGVTVYWR